MLNVQKDRLKIYTTILLMKTLVNNFQLFDLFETFNRERHYIRLNFKCISGCSSMMDKDVKNIKSVIRTAIQL